MVIFRVVLGSLASLVALVGLFGLCLPRGWRVERDVLVAAPPAAIFPLVNDLERGWAQWDSFAEPGMTITYEGAPSGVGAVSKFVHGSKTGRKEIVASDPAKGVRTTISMPGFHADTGIDFAPEREGTRVTWYSSGELANPFFRVMVFLFMKAMVRSKYDVGLARLKALAEEKRVAV